MALAALFCLTAILVGSFSDNTWKNTLITWIILSVGIALFGIALTL